MDLLDSIMSKMAKPPSIDDKQKKLMREQQKVLDEARSKEREELSKFRRQMEQRVHSFILDDRLEKLRLEPMEQVARSVVRDVADVAGLTTYTFGVEGEDRYVMLFKKDYPLDERELHAYRNGLEWDPAQAQRLTAQLAEAQREDEFREHLLQQQRRQQLRQQRQQQKTGQEDSSAVHPKFLDKIDRLVGGRQTGKQAAKSIVVDNDRTFGFVRSELKKDKRTIEQTLADIRAKKMKREHDSAIATSGNPALTSGNPAQTSGRNVLTSGNLAQTSGRNALTSGNLAQTSGNTAQTSGSHAHTSGNPAQISGNLARTSGSPASMSHNAIRTGSNSLNEPHVLSSCRKDSSNHQ